MNQRFLQAKQASMAMQLLTDQQRNDILLALADAIVAKQDDLLAANAQDLSCMHTDNPLYDRLMLTKERLESIAADTRNVAALPTPLGHVTEERVLPNGLHIRRVSVPFGVIGIVYEARPNVTFDVFTLCFKSGNACVLKGGRDAQHSNQAALDVIRQVLESHGVNPDVVQLLPPTHEATAQMLQAVGYIDLCIPRGGRKLIDFVRDNARIPVIETGAGVVHIYFDKEADLEMGTAIVVNAKTRRVSVCNALDTLIIHESRLADLPAILEQTASRHPLTVYADEQAMAAVKSEIPNMVILPSTPDTYHTEFMDYKLAVKTVASLEEAIQHIRQYGSGHSEAIVTDNKQTATAFQQQVDAACVYWNAPTSFTDGAQFGLGAEIGISTQKLGPRGPMGLREITTYKWLIDGQGQTRP